MNWSDYVEIARRRGALAQEFYLVESSPSGAAEAVKAMLPSHLKYQAEIEASGALFMAGPLSDDSGEVMSGGGMIIYRAGSFADARALADADPMHSSGARSYRMRRWLVNEGQLRLTVELSARRVLLP